MKYPFSFCSPPGWESSDMKAKQHFDVFLTSINLKKNNFNYLPMSQICFSFSSSLYLCLSFCMTLSIKFLDLIVIFTKMLRLRGTHIFGLSRFTDSNRTREFHSFINSNWDSQTGSGLMIFKCCSHIQQWYDGNVSIINTISVNKKTRLLVY
jgi:hypothetical protein